MFKRESEHTASEALADEQLDFVSGGDDMPPICPPYLPGRPWGGPGPVPFGATVLNLGAIQ